MQDSNLSFIIQPWCGGTCGRWQHSARIAPVCCPETCVHARARARVCAGLPPDCEETEGRRRRWRRRRRGRGHRACGCGGRIGRGRDVVVLRECATCLLAANVALRIDESYNTAATTCATRRQRKKRPLCKHGYAPCRLVAQASHLRPSPRPCLCMRAGGAACRCGNAGVRGPFAPCGRRGEEVSPWGGSMIVSSQPTWCLSLGVCQCRMEL